MSAVLCLLYVSSSRTRPLPGDHFWCREIFAVLSAAGGVKSKPVRAALGTRRMFLKRFLRSFVHDSCIESITVVDAFVKD